MRRCRSCGYTSNPSKGAPNAECMHGLGHAGAVVSGSVQMCTLVACEPHVGIGKHIGSVASQ